MKIINAKAWTIRINNRQDDRIDVLMYTPELGKICLKVQGGQKTDSKLLSAGSLFKELEISCCLAEGACFGRLISVKELRDIGLVCYDMDRFTEASFLCELLDVLTPYALPNNRKYRLFEECLLWAGGKKHFDFSGIYFFFNFLALSGQGIELDKCHHCSGTALREIYLASSGIVCPVCRGREKYVRKINPSEIEQIKRILVYGTDEIIDNINFFEKEKLRFFRDFLMPFYNSKPLKVGLFKKKFDTITK